MHSYVNTTNDKIISLILTPLLYTATKYTVLKMSFKVFVKDDAVSLTDSARAACQ